MRLVYKYSYAGEARESLRRMCEVSKNLYNQALYIIRQELKDNDRFIFYREIEERMKTVTNLEGGINYRLMPKTQCAQQCLKVLDKNVKSYVRSIKDWSKHPEKYNGKPGLPKYKKKLNQLIFTAQSCQIRDGRLILTKTLSIEIPQWEKYGDKLVSFQQVRINPVLDGTYFDIEIIYIDSETDNGELCMDRFASIDMGLNNFATMTDTEGNTVIYNGRQMKSINQWYNKERARLQEELSKNDARRRTSLGIRALTRKRNDRINDIMHKISRDIVRRLVRNRIGTLIVGHNKEWKDSINIGSVNNQNFVSIPHSKFISLLAYKCGIVGINVVTTEESYTSKCDALAMEEIRHHDTYLGKRKKRGLFQSSVGKLINADVNGALNIMRKVVGDSPVRRIVDRGRLFRPVLLRDIYHLGIYPNA